MKRFFAMLIAAVLVMALVPSAGAAGELPFELKAPINPTIRFIGEGAGNTLEYIYGMDNAMMSFFKSLDDAEDRDAFFSAYPFDEIWVTAQVDWAIDDINDPVSGWHYTQYWDGGVNGIGYDEDGNIRVSEWDCTDAPAYPQASNDVWVLRGCPDDGRWGGNPETNTPGVRDQLNPDQYEYYDDDVHIDYTKHTAYLRSRFVIETRTWDEDGNHTEEYYYSDWSATAAYGKDAETVEFDLNSVKPPVISNLRLADWDFNDYPVVLLTLTVPDELAQAVTAIAALGGGIWVDYEGRVQGDAEWVGLDGDGTVRAGEVEVKLQHLAETRGGISADDIVEIRALYRIDHPETGSHYTDYSNVISYNSDNVTVPTEVPGNGTEDEPTPEPEEGSPVAALGCSGCSCASAIWALIPLAALAVIKAVRLLASKR